MVISIPKTAAKNNRRQRQLIALSLAKALFVVYENVFRQGKRITLLFPFSITGQILLIFSYNFSLTSLPTSRGYERYLCYTSVDSILQS